MARLGAALSLSAILAACAQTSPITVSPTSVAILPPTSGGSVVTARPGPPAATASEPAGHLTGPQCSVRVAEVRDTRPDSSDLGMMGLRAVHTSDSVAWIQSALAALKQNSGLLLVDDDKEATITLRVELVKAYILTINTQKSSNVVLRVRYSHGDKEADSDVVRGRDTGGNWANGAEEAQGSLNRALSEAVLELESNLAARCRALAKSSS